MSKETYIKLKDYFCNHKKLGSVLKFLYTALPLLMFIAYPAMVIFKGFLETGHEFILMIVIPAVVFVGIKAIRKFINKERPYEKFGVSSFIEKDRVGQSFPSNHAACSFVIAMSGFGINTFVGCGLLVIAAVIALTRILAGVHFISDVIAGSVIGIIAGIVFIFI